jgi:hypothetical protein
MLLAGVLASACDSLVGVHELSVEGNETPPLEDATTPDARARDDGQASADAEDAPFQEELGPDGLEADAGDDVQDAGADGLMDGPDSAETTTLDAADAADGLVGEDASIDAPGESAPEGSVDAPSGQTPPEASPDDDSSTPDSDDADGD